MFMTLMEVARLPCSPSVCWYQSFPCWLILSIAEWCGLVVVHDKLYHTIPHMEALFITRLRILMPLRVGHRKRNRITKQNEYKMQILSSEQRPGRAAGDVPTRNDLYTLTQSDSLDTSSNASAETWAGVLNTVWKLILHLLPSGCFQSPFISGTELPPNR